MIKVEIWNNAQCIFNDIVQNSLYSSSALLVAARMIGLRCDEKPEKISKKSFLNLVKNGECVGLTYDDSLKNKTQYWVF